VSNSIRNRTEINEPIFDQSVKRTISHMTIGQVDG